MMEKQFQTAMDWIQSVKHSVLGVYHALDRFDLKANNTEVTEADRRTEAEFRALIDRHFPGDGIIGEEFSEQNRIGEYTWTIDPIDGTRAFTRGVPFFGTMVGLYRNNEILFGIIAFHALDELIYAIKDRGCFWKCDQSDFRPVRVSSTTDLAASVLSHSGEEYFQQYHKAELLERLKQHVHFTRTWGDCYGYTLLARGKIDIMMDPILSQWDLVPIKIVVEEAGGQFLTIDGSPSTIDSTSALCANAKLMAAILATL